MLLLYLTGYNPDCIATCIYIPLCFYFIRMMYLHRLPPPPFTFHYASTLSNGLLSRSHSLHHLHSIMLLLYLRSCSGHLFIRWIYIPLCFYFIPEGQQDILDKPLFTFHYASTLSRAVRDHPHNSTIYIPLCFYFIGDGADVRLLLLPIYIPLCFYFISVSPTSLAIFLNLHSIMLLLYHNCIFFY